ncbi:MAG: hypothetical protein M1816_008113 [Peltula sp. TS41687]|nr:MAG: hypothetical protein M1816_008113 [Peltula sp. TS41687]
MLRRPHRPYTFTQLLTLSDGSVTINRTTSPLPIYRSTKDTRNHPMWNPSSQKLANVEEDEAGRLRAFRKRFGRGWDAQATSMEGEEEDGEDGEDGNRDGLREQGDADGFGEQGLADLISGFGYEAQGAKEGNAGEGRSEKGKGKGKEKDKHE